MEPSAESVNEGRNNCYPITPTRPQPDFAVGFSKYTFTRQQHDEVEPVFGTVLQQSLYRATLDMYIPILSCGVKCGTIGLDIADRQNAHSMGIAKRGIVELFKLAGEHETLRRELVCFSISHDDHMVKLYWQYPILNGEDVRVYRHLIHYVEKMRLEDKLERQEAQGNPGLSQNVAGQTLGDERQARGVEEPLTPETSTKMDVLGGETSKKQRV